MRRRPNILRFLAALGLGFATTVGTAWILACMDIRPRGVESAERIRPLSDDTYRKAGDIYPQKGTYRPFMGGASDSVLATVYVDRGRAVIITLCNGPEFQPWLGIPGISFADYVP